MEVSTPEELRSGYDLIRETYQRIKLPFPPAALFENACRILGKKSFIKCFAATFEGNIIGVRFVFTYKDNIYDWYAGSSDLETNKYPNDFLIYHVLQWGCEKDFRIFDFGGAGKPDEPYGVREHKLKFGGDLINNGRFQKINNKLIYNFSKNAFKIWRTLKRGKND
jgi:lipid II:glycine glycyltransferase (peptidoglycan interpeptide bridge formation enzyme)